MSRTPEDGEPVLVRPATEADAPAMAELEASSQALPAGQGVDLGALRVPEELEEATTWSLAFVAEAGGTVVGLARLSELTSELVCLDQMSVSPQLAGRGVGRRLLTEVASACRDRGYAAITGTTFRDVAFNAPFSARLGGVEETDPHPVMVERRRVERELGLDGLGARLVMRLALLPTGSA